MPQINGPILNTSARPAWGMLRAKATRAFTTDGGLVTRALATATVTNGVPLVDGRPWTLPVTPDDVWIRIEQDLDGDTVEVAFVRVPDLAEMSYSELLFYRGGNGSTDTYWWDLTGGLDFPLEAANGDYGFDSTDDTVWRNVV